MITTYAVSDSYATVGAHEDIDGYVKRITVLTNRQLDEAAELLMDARTARMLARQLNKWARVIDPPKPRKK